jgi:hypothetical protein
VRCQGIQSNRCHTERAHACMLHLAKAAAVIYLMERSGIAMSAGKISSSTCIV